MKTYTHPTINLPAGAVVVKFYDDTLSGSETTPDLIEEIGEVTEGFDFELTELYLGSCEITMHNKDNYVLGTLLQNEYMRVAVLIDNKNYFYGEVGFETITIEGDDDPDTNQKYSKISFTSNNIITRLRGRTITHAKTNTTAFSPVDPSWTSHYYMRELLRAIAQMSQCAYSSTSDVHYLVARKYKYTDGGTGAVTIYLKDIIIKDDYFDTFDTSSLENNYTDNCDNALTLLLALAKDFFFYPQVIYDSGSSVFRLKIIEKDTETSITLPPVKKRTRAIKYLIKSQLVRLDNMPPTLVNGNLSEQFTKSYPEALYGDDIVIENLHTNIEDEDSTTTTAGGTLSTTPITISVVRTDFLDDSGDAIITRATPKTFSYTGKTATTLTGCTIPSGTYAFNNGDKVERADHSYVTNLILLRWDTVWGAIFPVDTVENANGSYNGVSFNIAISRAWKSIYYDNKSWQEYVVHGLEADSDMDKLFVGYEFTDNGRKYLIHEVTKSVMKNESKLLCLDIGAAP